MPILRTTYRLLDTVVLSGFCHYKGKTAVARYENRACTRYISGAVMMLFKDLLLPLSVRPNEEPTYMDESLACFQRTLRNFYRDFKDSNCKAHHRCEQSLLKDLRQHSMNFADKFPLDEAFLQHLKEQSEK